MDNFNMLKEITTVAPILIVDDNEALSEILAENLECLGIKSIIFSRPLDVVSYVQDNKENIHLIVTDYHMPELTGLEMIQAIHQEVQISYVLMSGQLQKITDDYCESEIARLSKPFNTDELADLIAKFYQRRSKYALEA